ncbi:hypothetical protein PQE72_gp069 [Bacillus phage vB_BanS_Skywalker]|uniref:Uncharacterized protein n=1 Tax=Bacillus phage vB_BanS_Skywalker TaxID=2894789 RepID=A0AAE9CEG5_9CAUD|nr:hypothetical protein PQE72_gp069 [Bacillus phage vB_BanS_Skywalker]UGO51374.1 hypothetical protein SKYWALKER_217 [Bacillus phage vB_BanS_Skywalker]
MFFKRKPKIIKLIDFSIQNVSSGQVVGMLEHLGFKLVNVNYGKNEYGDTRCYLTIDHEDRRVIQWVKDRNPSQVEEFAKRFKMNADDNYTLDGE